MEMCGQLHSQSGLTAWKADSSHLTGNRVDPEVGLDLSKQIKSLLSRNLSFLNNYSLIPVIAKKTIVKRK
jgi:hypothetical protein